MSKILPLNDEWRLSVEGLNVTLQQYREIENPQDKTTRQEWCFVGYYGSIQQAGRALPSSITLHSDYEGWAELCAKLVDVIAATKSLPEGV